jgi:chorismate mutase / prephenate dehydratase
MKRTTKTGSVKKSIPKPTKVKAAATAQGSKKPIQSISLDQQVVEIDQQLMSLLAERVQLLHAMSKDTSSPPAALWEQQQKAAAVALKFAEQKQLTPTMLVDWVKHTTSFCQHEVRMNQPIAYLGPMYSYSYLAAVKHFGQASTLVPVATIAAVFDELVRGQSAFGVVPIENSTDGRIVDTLGMFHRWPVHICGEVLLPVHHCLLGRCPRGEITEVYSKPQALSQCRGWLSSHVPDARLIEVASTAHAARLAADKQGAAAIASFEAGLHHGLEIIDENIEDNTDNVTRFAVIGNRTCEPTGRDKTSLMFQLKHQPGALADAMITFQQAKINLTWIESFPLPRHPNEYMFFVELEGHKKTKAVGQALQKLQDQVVQLDILGSYPRGVS